MNLLLNLNQQDGVWIDGSHRVFEKTEFEGLIFKVKIKPLTRTELRKVRREGQTQKGFDQDITLPKIFTSQVLDWELKSADGQVIPFTEENKKILAEQFPILTNLVAAACMDSNIQTINEDEIKNLSTSGTGE
jgi:hypothetical protein